VVGPLFLMIVPGMSVILLTYDILELHGSAEALIQKILTVCFIAPANMSQISCESALTAHKAHGECLARMLISDCHAGGIPSHGFSASFRAGEKIDPIR
jgi:hypothetical protein